MPSTHLFVLLAEFKMQVALSAIVAYDELRNRRNATHVLVRVERGRCYNNVHIFLFVLFVQLALVFLNLFRSETHLLQLCWHTADGLLSSNSPIFSIVCSNWSMVCMISTPFNSTKCSSCSSCEMSKSSHFCPVLIAHPSTFTFLYL